MPFTLPQNLQAKYGQQIGQTGQTGGFSLPENLQSKYGSTISQRLQTDGKSSISQKLMGIPEKIVDISGMRGTTETLGKILSPLFATPQSAKYLEKATGKELAGAGLQIGSLVAPYGEIAKGLEVAGISGKIGAGALGGYALETGQSLEKNKGLPTPGITTALGAGIPAISQAIGGIKNAIIPQTVKENISKVLGYTGKIGLGEVATDKKITDAVNAFSTILKLSPEIKVLDKNGIEKIFNPKTADFHEMPQALYHAKNKIYEEYNKLADKAGEIGAKFTQKDFNDVINTLNKYSEKGYTPAFSNKANQIKEAINRFGKLNPKTGEMYFSNTNPSEIQTLIENINQDVNPLSDKAGAKVANEASSAIREILDKKITSATGSEYQKLRTAYSQLKSIEPSILNQYKKVMRKAGVSSDILNGLAVVDSLQGILTGSPTETIRGALIGSIKSAYQYFRDPEVNLRRAFNLLEKPTKQPFRMPGDIMLNRRKLPMIKRP